MLREPRTVMRGAFVVDMVAGLFGGVGAYAAFGELGIGPLPIHGCEREVLFRSCDWVNREARIGVLGGK